MKDLTGVFKNSSCPINTPSTATLEPNEIVKEWPLNSQSEFKIQEEKLEDELIFGTTVCFII